MNKLLLVLFLLPFSAFAQECYDPIACNYGANEECVYENSNTIDITNNTWLQEIDEGCDGTIDQVWYTEYYSDGSYNYGSGFWDIYQNESSWSLCNDQFIDNYNYSGTVNSEGAIEGLIPSFLEPACNWACWRMVPVTTSDIYGCQDELACNYYASATISSNDCIYTENCSSFNQVIDNNDEICIEGCVDPESLTYNPDAIVSNYALCIYDWNLGPCQYVIDNGNIPPFLLEGEVDDDAGWGCIVSGCTDDLACNYMSPANIDDGSCYYAEPGYDCNENCISLLSYAYQQEFDFVEILQAENCNIPVAELTLPNDNWIVNLFSAGGNSNVIDNVINGPFESNDEFVTINLDVSYQVEPYQECNESLEYDIPGGWLVDALSDLESQICYITVEDNQNVIHWNNSIANINEYKIYRENAASDYELIASIASDEDLEFIDESSVASQQSYKYLLSGADECGIETAMSSNHETIHLTSNLGVGGENNLSWNAYVGFTYETHQIFRSNNVGDFELINEVSASNYSYSDLTPPSGINQYFISITQTEECQENPLELIPPSFNCVDWSSCVDPEDGTGFYATYYDCMDQCVNGSIALPVYANSDLFNSSTSNTIESVTEDATWSCIDNICGVISDVTGEYSTLEECEAECIIAIEDSWNCLNNACVDPEDGSGFYSTLDACETSCGETIDPSWSCVNDACVDPEDGSGLYSALADCEAECITSSITDPNKANKKLKKITNLLGQQIPIRKNTPMFYIYNDGSVEKKIIIE